MYSQFICGVPHNSKGFQYAVIEGAPLPKDISQFIDIYDSDKMKEGQNYIIQKLEINNLYYTLIAKYVRINPSDQKSSRGSYIAVGLLTNKPICTEAAIGYIYEISSKQDILKAMRNKRNAFDIDFMMNDVFHQTGNYKYAMSLANVIEEMSLEKIPKKILFDTLKYNYKNENSKDNRLKDDVSLINRLMKKLGIR